MNELYSKPGHYLTTDRYPKSFYRELYFGISTSLPRWRPGSNPLGFRVELVLDKLSNQAMPSLRMMRAMFFRMLGK